MLKFMQKSDTLAEAEYDGYTIKREYGERGYSFSYVTESCAEAVRKYAKKEEIPLVYTEVPRQALGALISKFRHADVDAEDASASTYRVTVKSELALLDEIPTVRCGEVSLGKIADEDISEYARLSREPSANEFWGYDYRLDNSEPSDEYFINEAKAELMRGTAISLAVRFKGTFIGEAVLFGFDLSGGAEIGIRLLSEWRSQGLGALALEALIQFAEKIGLVRLRAEVMCENAASVRLFSSFMDEVFCEGGRVYFELSAEEDE